MAAPSMGYYPGTVRQLVITGPGRDAPTVIITNDSGINSITVKINRRAYSPVLRHARVPDDTTVPWWGGRQRRPRTGTRWAGSGLRWPPGEPGRPSRCSAR
jgi:hypothetical protein